MNVYDAAVNRIKRIFDDFDNVYVAFSGGKDSGVMLNMALSEARKRGRKMGMFHIDYEAQYQATTDYVDSIIMDNQDVLDVYRICLPISAQCATSMFQNHWTPWEDSKKDIWVRKLPDQAIHIGNHPFVFFREGMWDYELQEQFSCWYHAHKNARRTAVLVGIRTQESLNRWRAIYSERNYRNHQGLKWSKKVSENVYNFYPIYDWLTQDIWTANGRFGWTYNKLYDLYHQAGISIDKMRVASPFNDYAMGSLKLYRAIDPDNWGKMVGRVNGVNFAGIYGGTTAMGWKSVKLPPGHTWESYMHFLLATLPEKTKSNYLNKLEKSKKFWREKGGVLDDRTISDIVATANEVNVSEYTNYSTDKKTVRMEYLDNIDTPEFAKVPTYKRMCVCIMKNDHLCKYMGFSQTKHEIERRKAIVDKYKSIL